MSAGQAVGAVVGGVIGFIVGGPMGAAVGASLGMGVGGIIDPMGGPGTSGPRLSDLSVQTSTYGAHIPRLYGTVGGMGNLIWLENNKLKETVRKKKSGGKGGGGSSEPTKTYSYSATFHLALCEGPIAGIRRIWCGDKLIYNAGSDDLETIIASNQNATAWKLYTGTDNQMPDPRYEAEYGVGNVSAHRGLAYIAFYDFKLADYSNTLQAAQFKVEVVSISEQSTTLIKQVSAAYEQPHSNSGYAPNPWYVSDTKVDFYVPQWSTSAVQRVLKKYTFSTSSGRSSGDFVGSISSESPDVGYSYSDGFYLFGRAPFFSSLAYGFTWSSGYIVVGENSAAGIGGGNDEGRRIALAKNIGSFTQSTIDVAAPNSFGVALDETSEYVFVVYQNSIEKLDYDLSLVSSVSVSIYGVVPSPGQSRSRFIDGYVWVWINSGSDNRLIKIDPDSGEKITYTFSVYSDRTVRGENFNVVDGLAIFATQNNFTNTLYVEWYNLNSTSSENESLANIIESEVSKSGLIGAADIDTSLIAESVRGYRVQGGSIRSALGPLQSAFPFDVRAHGYKIQFLPRGQASVATIPWEDLGATTGDTPDDIFPQSREMDTQLPAKTVVKYLDAAREYAIGEQFSERLNTEAVNKVERDLAIVLNADEAAGIAEMLNFLPWLERTPASFTLPPPYRYLEAGDVVTVVTKTATHEIRLNDVNETQDGRLECKAAPNRSALYTPAASGSEGVPPSGNIPLAGVSLFVPLDIPVIDETLQDAPGFVGVVTGYTEGWPGALAVRSIDDGQTWADLQGYSGKATIGTARGTLAASNCTLIDQRTLTVGLISGELESVTRDQMLAGINYAAYGVDGRWEIVRFQNAVLQAGGEYIVSGFVRGEKGTEWATGLHQAGDYFILLDDPDNAFIGMAVGAIAVPATCRGVTSGASVDDATDVPFTYQGVNLECLSPVYAKGARDGSSNFTGTFTRRSRLSSSWWANGVAAPVGEAGELYEIDVMSGSTAVRTITTTAPSFTYSAANQTTDFGSAQSSITFRIYQISATVGRGYPLEVTL